MDDKQFVILGLGDRVGWVKFLMGFPYVVALGGGIGWFVTEFREPKALYVALVALVLALTIHYISTRMKHNQFTVFDRELGTVHFPKGLFSSKVYEDPWEDWSARLVVASTSVGVPEHNLFLLHKPTHMMGFLSASLNGIDDVLAYWSFLVQYMDKNAPLPDVEGLKQYPNRSKGLGTWAEWRERETRGDRIDPYHAWLAELNEDPSLDEVNARIEAMRRA